MVAIDGPLLLLQLNNKKSAKKERKKTNKQTNKNQALHHSVWMIEMVVVGRIKNTLGCQYLWPKQQ